MFEKHLKCQCTNINDKKKNCRRNWTIEAKIEQILKNQFWQALWRLKVLWRVLMIYIYSQWQCDMPDFYTVRCSLVFWHVNYNVYYKCISDSWNTKPSRDYKFGYIFFFFQRGKEWHRCRLYRFFFVFFIYSPYWLDCFMPASFFAICCC